MQVSTCLFSERRTRSKNWPRRWQVQMRRTRDFQFVVQTDCRNQHGLGSHMLQMERVCNGFNILQCTLATYLCPWYRSSYDHTGISSETSCRIFSSTSGGSNVSLPSSISRKWNWRAQLPESLNTVANVSEWSVFAYQETVMAESCRLKSITWRVNIHLRLPLSRKWIWYLNVEEINNKCHYSNCYCLYWFTLLICVHWLLWNKI